MGHWRQKMSSACRRFGPALLWVVALSAYGVFLANYVGAYAAGSDSSGYLNSARLLGEGRWTTSVRVWPNLSQDHFAKTVYVPLGFRPTSTGDMAPSYPIGTPVLVMLTSQVVGWRAGPHVMILIHALAGVILQAWLGRCAGLSRGWSSLGALLLAGCPLYVVYSLQMMSDVPATTWAMASVLLAWQARRHDAWAIASGAAFAVALLIRPTNVLVMIPTAIAVGVGWRRWLGFLIGVSPGVAAQLAYNHAAYGAFLASGYGNVTHLFRWDYLPLSLACYSQWLPVLLTPLGLFAVFLPLCVRTHAVWTILLTAWILGFGVVYGLYYHTHETWWYLRFLLPAFPAVWVASLLVLQSLTRWIGMQAVLPAGSIRAWISGLCVAAALIGFDWHWNEALHSRTVADAERSYVEAIEWMRPHVPESALLIAMQASGALTYYTDLPVLRWDRLGPTEFQHVAKAGAGDAVYALLQPFEEERAFRENVLGGSWTRIGSKSNFSLWRLEPGAAK